MCALAGGLYWLAPATSVGRRTAVRHNAVRHTAAGRSTAGFHTPSAPPAATPPPPAAPAPAPAPTQLPLAPYPSPARLRAAKRFLAARAGRKAFAVIDDEGRLEGYHVHSRFHSASVVKSMLLVAYLRWLARAHRGLDERQPWTAVSDDPLL